MSTLQLTAKTIEKNKVEVAVASSHHWIPDDDYPHHILVLVLYAAVRLLCSVSNFFKQGFYDTR